MACLRVLDNPRSLALVNSRYARKMSFVKLFFFEQSGEARTNAFRSIEVPRPRLGSFALVLTVRRKLLKTHI